MNADLEFVELGEIAKLAGVSRKTLNRRFNTGKLVPHAIVWHGKKPIPVFEKSAAKGAAKRIREVEIGFRLASLDGRVL